MTALTDEQGHALGDWWCNVRDEHGTYDFEDAVRHAVIAEAMGLDRPALGWDEGEIYGWLDDLFGSDYQRFHAAFLNGLDVGEGGLDNDLESAWVTLHTMGRLEGIRCLAAFFGEGT